MKVAVIGATGLVGGLILKVLEERRFPVSELIPVATEKSFGKKVYFKGFEYRITSVETALLKEPVLAVFSAGSETSRQWAAKFAEKGCRVIDNSSAWRMDESKKLIVPEVNGHTLEKNDYIIANPNCSTAILVMALAPLHKNFGVKRVVVSTYQSVSGKGQQGVEELMNQRNGGSGIGVYPHRIDMNIIPHIDVFTDNGYTKEELKMTMETVKIMGDENIRVAATAARVPVTIGHCLSVNIEFQKDFQESEVREILSETPGVIVVDNPAMSGYPMPIDCAGKDEVFVGRIRRDFTQDKTLNCWIAGDNLRKGAATNAVQIAKLLYTKGWVR